MEWDVEVIIMMESGSLEFGGEEVVFEYQPKGHLAASISVSNPTASVAYFKFKLTRPKYYLLKPDRGFIEPHHAANLALTLHADGLPLADTDKIKCYYRFLGRTHDEPAPGWEKDSLETHQARLLVTVRGLPPELQSQETRMRSSEVRSISQSKFERPSGMLEGSIRDKEGKVASLQQQVESLQQRGSRGPEGSATWLYAAAGAGGLLLGLLSSLWL